MTDSLAFPSVSGLGWAVSASTFLLSFFLARGPGLGLVLLLNQAHPLISFAVT